jgi:Helix-turn-helix domain
MAEHHDILWAIMKDSKISAAAKCAAVVLLLKYRNKATGLCNPSFDTVAKAMGRTRRPTIEALRELKSLGWLRWTGTAGGSSKNTNSFTFQSPEGVLWAAPVPSTTPVSSSVGRGAEDSAEGVLQTAHELSIEPSINSCADAPRSEGSALPAWARPAGNGKFFVRIESEGGDLIAQHCKETNQKLPMVSNREGAYIVPYVWPPGLDPRDRKARKEAAA